MSESVKKRSGSPSHSQTTEAAQDQPGRGREPVDGKERRAAAKAEEEDELSAARQSQLFDEAVSLFLAGKFEEALRRFELAARGPVVEMAHAARQRANMCLQRLAHSAEPALSSAEDHYNYAVVLLNARRWEQAEAHLEKALEQNPEGAHIYYALAVCRCWRGDVDGAAELLRRAIEIEPQNAIVARNDPDLAHFIQQPALAAILRSDRTRPQ